MSARERGDLPIMTVVVMLLGGVLVTVSAALVGLAGRAVTAEARTAAYDTAVHLAKGALNAFYSQLEADPNYFDDGSSWPGADGSWHSFGPDGHVAPCADVGGVAGLDAPGGPGCWELSVRETSAAASSGAPGPSRATSQPQEAATVTAQAYTDCHGALYTCTAAAVVQHFQRRDFLDYLYFTNQEVVDPTFASPNFCSSSAGCSEPAYVTGDVVDGPVHTNSPNIWACGSPRFEDVVEATGNPVWEQPAGGSSYCSSSSAGTPTFNGEVADAPALPLPASDRYLGQLAAAAGSPWGGQDGYAFPGSVTVALAGNALDITYDGNTYDGVPLPSTGVVYASGDVYVSGQLRGQLTVAAGSNIYVTGSLTYGSQACAAPGPDGAPFGPSCKDYLGLVADGSVFIEDDGSATTVDAAMLALSHSISVDPETMASCSGSCPVLTIDGAMASQYRGVFGAYEAVEVPPPTTTTAPGATTTPPPPPTWQVNYEGFTKSFSYDTRLFHESPPWMLSDQTGGWVELGQVVVAAPTPVPTTTTTTTAPTTTTATTVPTTTTTVPLTCPKNVTSSPVPNEPWAYEADAGYDPTGVATANPANQVVAETPVEGRNVWGDFIDMRPTDLLASPDGSKIYMAVNGYGIDVMSTADDAMIGVWAAYLEAYSLGQSPDGQYLYAAGLSLSAFSPWASSSYVLQKVDAGTGGTVASVVLPYMPQGNLTGEKIGVTPDGQYLYVDMVGHIGVYRASDLSQVAMIAVPSQYGSVQDLAVTPDGSSVYATASGNSVIVISTSSNTVTGSVNVGTATTGIAMSPDGTAFVEGNSGDDVYAINTGLRQVSYSMPFPENADPAGMEVTQDGAYLYVAEQGPGVPNTPISQTEIFSTQLHCPVSFVPSGWQGDNSYAYPADVALVPSPAPASAASQYNNVGISSDSAPSDANFDSEGDSYSAAALEGAGVTPGSAITWNGLDFTWPDVAAGTPDNWLAAGQTIPLSLPAGTLRLGILGAAAAAGSWELTVNYTDGTSSTAQFSMPSWTEAGWVVPESEIAVTTASAYQNPAGKANPVTSYVFATQVPVNPTKTVESLTLPSTVFAGELHVFAFAGAATGSSFDNVGITSSSDASAGQFDSTGDSYLSSALSSAGLSQGAAFAAQGAQMTWPSVAPGQADDWSTNWGSTWSASKTGGDIIPAPSMPAGAQSLVLAGAAAGGPAYGTMELGYSDNTVEQVDLGLPDWGDTSTPDYSDTVVARMSQRDGPNGPQSATTSVFAGSVPLLPGKTLVWVELPTLLSYTGGGYGFLHVFAVGGSTQAATGAPAIFSLSPSSAYVGEQVAINGIGFGASQGASQVAFENAALGYGAVNPTVDSWSNTQIVFTVPQYAPPGSAVQPGQTALVWVTLANKMQTGQADLKIVAAP